MTKTLHATCGHNDPLGYFTNTPCHKCTVKAHRSVTQPNTPPSEAHENAKVKP